jgi:DNA-binding transcriptional MerR regulator
VESNHRDEQVTIGEFARLARLTPKALRVYEREGVLRPLDVDAFTGYRRYDPSQLAMARLIAMLRGTDMSLSDIRLVLDDLAIEPFRATERLGAHLESLEQQHTSRRSLVRHIHALLRKEPEPMYTTSTRHVPAQRVMSIQRRLRAPETDPFVEEAKAAFRAALGDRKPTGPFTVIFHGIVDNESDGPIEAILGCPEDLLPNEVVGIRTEPAHDEAYTTITKAQWAYPAILAAYDAVASSPHATARPGSRLSCREVYLAEPNDATDDELLCDIAFPLG